MANKVEILNLDINTSALISKMTETRAEIDKLKAAQKDLTNSNQSTSDAFTKNAVEIGRLQSSYNTQKSVVTQLSTANDAFAKATDAITSAVAKENTSIASARENNTQLLALRNQLNTKTVEGQTALAGINAKLDQNNAYIKSNVSAYEQQKISIGEYKKGITDAFQAINPLNGGMAGLAARATEAGGAGNLLKESLGGATAGVWGMIKASLAFIATPIGAVVAVIAGAFLILYEIFKGFAPILNPIKDAFAALGAVFEVLKSSIFQLVTGGKSLTEVFSGMGSSMKDAAAEAYKLAAAQRAVTKEQRLLDVATAKATTQIQQYILKSKDKTATDEERVAYINKAQKIEEDINKRQLAQQNNKIANARLAVAEGKLISEDDMKQMAKGNSAFAQSVKVKYGLEQELIDKLRQGEIDKEGINQAHNAIIEKSQNRENTLIENGIAAREKAAKEGEAAAQKRTEAQSKLVDKSIQKNKDEIEYYIQSQGVKKKSFQDELLFEETLYKKKLDLLTNQLNQGKITQTAFDAESLKVKNEYLKKQADLTVANADAELKAFVDANKSKLDANKYLNDTLYQQELERINKVSEAEAAAQTKRLEAGTINAEQYGLAITAIDATTAANKKAVDDTKIEADKVKTAIDLENKRLVTQTEFELQISDLDIKRQNELAATEKTGADKALINAKYDAAEVKMKQAQEQSKIAIISQSMDTAKGLFKENTLAYKAIAIAQTTMNTYSAAMKAYDDGLSIGGPAGLVLGPVMAGVAVAAGLKNVATIAGVKFADGGQVPTLGAGVINNGANIIPQSNGDNTLAYVRQGEVILNESQQRAAGGSNFFKSLGVPGFNGGGIVGGNSNLGTQGGLKIDIDLLAYKVAQANRMLPAPVVSVTDISYHQNRIAVIENGANL